MNSLPPDLADPAQRHADSWRWFVCGLLLLATMLNYMDRQTLSQSATDISRELNLSNEDYGSLERGFGLAFAFGGLILGVVVDYVSVRWIYPAVLIAWSAAGFATAWSSTYNELLICRIVLGFFEAGQWPCALTVSQRILARRDRALGNSILQSGAALGAIATPLVVQALVTDEPGTWRLPFQVIGVAGLFWAALWLVAIRSGDLDRRSDTAAAKGDPDALPESSVATFIRKFLVLTAVVISINLCWQFYRAWLPKFLREFHGYDRSTVNYFTSAFYIATDVGCLAAGFAVKLLVSRRGMSVHGSKVLVFTVCAMLTSLSVVVARLGPGPLLFAVLLIIAAGALGLFPNYYSLTQELSSKHQGKVTGTLGFLAWTSSAFMQSVVGRWVDQTGSYALAISGAGLAPLIGWIALILFWDWPPWRAFQKQKLTFDRYHDLE